MSTGVSRFFDDGSAQFAGWAPTLWDPHGAAMVDAAAPAPGERVLDACCGAGSSALPAAHAVGPSGRVHGIDALTDVRVRRREQDIPIDADRGWDFLHSGPVRSVLGHVDSDTVDRIRETFRDTVTAEGIDLLRAPCLIATGTVGR